MYRAHPGTPAIDSLTIERHNRALVVRDDLFPGGSKYRALVPYLARLGAREAVFPGPAWGGGPYALACACRDLGIRCTLFYAARKDVSARQRLAIEAGARIEWVRPGYLTVVRARAAEYCRTTGATLIEWGMPESRSTIAALAARVDTSGLSEVWCAAGSGNLLRALHSVYAPRGLLVRGVQVGAEPREVPEGVRVFKHPLAFEQRTSVAVPFPSCRHYDAKAWEFAVRATNKRFLFWNVMSDADEVVAGAR